MLLSVAADRWCVCVSTGIDSEGHAANFVESEQIVLYEGAKASFVQVSFRVHHISDVFTVCIEDHLLDVLALRHTLCCLLWRLGQSPAPCDPAEDQLMRTDGISQRFFFFFETTRHEARCPFTGVRDPTSDTNPNL